VRALTNAQARLIFVKSMSKHQCKSIAMCQSLRLTAAMMPARLVKLEILELSEDID
jgi:hypothetical protein